MALIGLLGIKGSGKSTAADYLVKKHNYTPKCFADCLKYACQELFLLNHDQTFGTQEQKETPDLRWYGCTPRKMMQFVGTDVLRNNLERIMPGIGNNVFIHHFKIWYLEQLNHNPEFKVVIADVRFQNEVDFIHSLGGKVIKIDRPNVLTEDSHQSEIELQKIINYDYLIDNNTGTINDLHQKLENYLAIQL